jgi:hypothetical protein
MAESQTPVVYNQALTTSESTITLATNTKKLLVKSRDVVTTIRVAYTATGTQTGPYFTIPPGSAYAEDDLHMATVIYLAADTGSCTAEVLGWS